MGAGAVRPSGALILLIIIEFSSRQVARQVRGRQASGETEWTLDTWIPDAGYGKCVEKYCALFVSAARVCRLCL